MTNKAVRDMINDMSSGNHRCMNLVRLLALNNLRFNRKITVQYVESSKNVLADALSRKDYQRFWKNAPENTDLHPTPIPNDIWPIEKVWMK